MGKGNRSYIIDKHKKRHQKKTSRGGVIVARKKTSRSLPPEEDYTYDDMLDLDYFDLRDTQEKIEQKMDNIQRALEDEIYFINIFIREFNELSKKLETINNLIEKEELEDEKKKFDKLNQLLREDREYVM